MITEFYWNKYQDLDSEFKLGATSRHGSVFGRWASWNTSAVNPPGGKPSVAPGEQSARSVGRA